MRSIVTSGAEAVAAVGRGREEGGRIAERARERCAVGALERSGLDR